MSRSGRHAAAALLAVASALLVASSLRARPSQPVAYSHRLHVTEYRIDCRFCHIYATKTATAGIPSAEKCLMCHRVVAAERPGIRAIAQYAERKEPIPWVRVTELPEFTYFPHYRMVNAGVPCLTCHPGIDKGDEAVQRQEFTMGFCLKCHRSRGVSIDCWTCHV